MSNVDDFSDFLDDDELDFLRELDKKDDEELKEEEQIILELFRNLVGMASVADKLSIAIHNITDLTPSSLQEEDETVSQMKSLVEKYSKVSNQINHDIRVVYDYTDKINYFWHGCSIETYTTNFATMKERYLEKYKMATELDLFKSEYLYYLIGKNIDTNVAHQTVRGGDYLSMLNYHKFLTYDNTEFFRLINARKMEYLEQELDKLGYTIEVDNSKETPTVKFIDSVAVAEKNLTLSGLPKFNVQQRYEIFKRLGGSKIVDTLDTKQMSKYNLLAVILNINPDNSKRLYNNSYKEINSKDLKSVTDFLEKQGISE